jgi:hypothetical protein
MHHTGQRSWHSVLALLLLLGNQPGLADSDRPPKPDQAPPGSGAARNGAFPPGMVQTYVGAHFGPTETRCFTMSGLLALGTPSSISLTFSHDGPTALNFNIKREGDVVIPSIDDGTCRIQMAVSKEVRDGDQWLTLHASALPLDPGLSANAVKSPPGEVRTVAPGLTASADPRTGRGVVKMKNGDTYVTVGAGFVNDPQRQCLQRKDFFSVSQRGLNIWFLSARAELPFSIEEQLFPAAQGKLIRFVTPTLPALSPCN